MSPEAFGALSQCVMGHVGNAGAPNTKHLLGALIDMSQSDQKNAHLAWQAMLLSPADQQSMVLSGDDRLQRFAVLQGQHRKLSYPDYVKSHQLGVDGDACKAQSFVPLVDLPASDPRTVFQSIPEVRCSGQVVGWFEELMLMLHEALKSQLRELSSKEFCLAMCGSSVRPGKTAHGNAAVAKERSKVMVAASTGPAANITPLKKLQKAATLGTQTILAERNNSNSIAAAEHRLRSYEAQLVSPVTEWARSVWQWVCCAESTAVPPAFQLPSVIVFGVSRDWPQQTAALPAAVGTDTSAACAAGQAAQANIFPDAVLQAAASMLRHLAAFVMPVSSFGGQLLEKTVLRLTAVAGVVVFMILTVAVLPKSATIESLREMKNGLKLVTELNTLEVLDHYEVRCEAVLTSVYQSMFKVKDHIALAESEVYVHHAWGHYLFLPVLFGKAFVNCVRPHRWRLPVKAMEEMSTSIRVLARLLWTVHLDYSQGFDEVLTALPAGSDMTNLLQELAQVISASLGVLVEAFPNKTAILVSHLEQLDSLVDRTRQLKNLQSTAAVLGVDGTSQLQQDVSFTVDVVGFLSQFGLVPSGTIKETGSFYCILNDWQGRDAMAHAFGTFDGGMFSVAGQVHGRWYCCQKP
eukprot:gene7986-8183_t